MVKKTKDAPVGVKVIAILYYIGAASLALLSMFAFVGGNFLSSLFGNTAGLGLGVFFAIIILGFAFLAFFIGRGLWKSQNWARVLAIIFAILGIFGAFKSLFAGAYASSILDLAIEGWIAWYLLFQKDMKKFFK